MYDFTTTIKTAWKDRNDDPVCDYWDTQDRPIEIISQKQYKVIGTNEFVKVNPTTKIYGCYR